MSAYDSWLLRQADEYMESFCDGEPKVIDAYKEFEGYDSEGNPEYSMDYTYSCEDCEETDCEYWKQFHDTEEEDEDA